MTELVRLLTERRRVDFTARDPAAVWGDIRPGDVEDSRALIKAVMGDIRRKRSWDLAWRLVTGLAHPLLWKPFGQYMDEAEYLRGIGGRDAGGRDLLSAADVAALQRLYTLTHAGCSAVLAWDEAKGRMVHFRSVDWPSAPAIANASRIVDGIGEGGSFSALGILGMVGLLTAVKPGFSVAINFAPWRGPSISAGTEPTFLLRQLMASPAASYAEAFQRIAAWRPAAPVFVTLCGTRRGEACCFEFGAAWSRPLRLNVRRMGDDGVLIQTNHFADGSPFAGHNRRQVPGRPWDDAGWDGHDILRSSVARQTLLAEELSKGKGEDMETVLRRVYARRPVWNPVTAQWAMMVPETGDLTAWVRN